jgi:hypothetical protein
MSGGQMLRDFDDCGTLVIVPDHAAWIFLFCALFLLDD